MNGAESLLQTVVASDIEVNFVNFGTTEVPLMAAFDSIGGAAAAPLRCQNAGFAPYTCPDPKLITEPKTSHIQ